MKSARGHMVFSRPCAHVRRHGPQRQTRCARRAAAAGRDAHRVADDRRAGRAWPTARASACRARATSGRDGGEHGDLYVDRPRRAAPGVPARRRRPACGRAGRGARGGARRADRRADARRRRRGCACRRARSRASGSACASAARRRRADGRGRSGRRGAARAAEAARRAVEGAAAGVRPDQRRGRRGQELA